jgi:hypothetical protein
MEENQQSTALINNLLTKIANLEWQNTQLQVENETLKAKKEDKNHGSN